MAPARVLVAVLLLAVPFAGCADDPPPIVGVRAQGADGFLMRPLAYDGTATPVQGDALVDVDGAANTGTVRVTASAGNDSYEVTWTQFAADPTKPFHDGGIATDFQEHGGSGVGDTSIPEVHLLAAGWGQATVTKNGQPYPDPVTGQPTWAAHFMVTDTGVFGADRTVRATGGGIYDPARAGEGVAEAGDAELHVVLRNNAGEPRNATPIEVAQTAQGQVAQDLTADIPESASLEVTLFVRPAQPPVPAVAQLALSLKDPTGAEVGTLVYQPGSPETATFQIDAPQAGTWTVSANGTGAGATWGATFVPTPPASAMLYFVFEDVQIETR